MKNQPKVYVMHVSELILLLLFIHHYFSRTPIIVTAFLLNPKAVVTNAQVIFHRRKEKQPKRSLLLVVLRIKRDNSNNGNNKYGDHHCTDEKYEEARNAFHVWCNIGNVRKANIFLQECIYYYYCNHSMRSNNVERQQILIRDVQHLLNSCTLPQKTSDFKVRMATRLLHLQNNLGSTSKQNAISLSMILRACTSLQQAEMVQNIYNTVFCGASSQVAATSMSFQRDVVLCNGMLDSLLSCQFKAEAYQMFYNMLLTTYSYQQQDPITMAFTLRFFLGVSQETAIGLATSYSTNPSSSSNNLGNDRPQQVILPKPNQRTFNIFLKGLTLELKLNNGHNESSAATSTTTWEQIKLLTQYMKSIGMWDAITTNTLVNAHVSCCNFIDAEKLLSSETIEHSDKTTSSTAKDHPNVQAYTELYVGYMKQHQYEKAKHVLEVMKSRNVSPNLFTYTAMVQSLARQGAYFEMESLLKHLISTKYRDKRNIGDLYNAIFTGLLLDNVPTNAPDDDHHYASRIQCAIKLFHGLFYSSSKRATRCKLLPNNVVLLSSILFQGLARHCSKISKDLVTLKTKTDAQQQQYRQKEQVLRNYVKVSSNIHQLLRQLGYANLNNTSTHLQHNYNVNARMHTPLMTIYASIQDLEKVKLCFSSIEIKDTKALNSYMDACLKCNSSVDALRAFHLYIIDNRDSGINDDNNNIRPDVATYTILITSILRSATEKKHYDGSVESESTILTKTLFPDSENELLNKKVTELISIVPLVAKRAQLLYEDMISRWNIEPDKALIDSIVNTLCSRPFFDSRLLQLSTITSLRNEDSKTRVVLLKFLKQILSDAKKYKCYSSVNADLQRQLNAEYETLVSKVKKCVEIERALQKKQMEQLFRNKGWNEVDSSFRIFGGYQPINSFENAKEGRDWLESKGWNDVDSGFKLI